MDWSDPILQWEPMARKKLENNSILVDFFHLETDQNGTNLIVLSWTR